MAPPSGVAEPRSRGFAQWLSATMQSRGLSQAQLARVVGVADTQVSRWRRGQVVPTVRYLQRIADTLDVPRTDLDRLAGYPVDALTGGEGDAPPEDESERQAVLHAYGATFSQLLERRVPRPLWQAYAVACTALAESMAGAYGAALSRAGGPRPEGDAGGVPPEGPGEPEGPDTLAPAPPSRPAGFRR